MDGIEIAYQNKDITSKVLAENFKGKTFRSYGLNLPEVRRALPTNLPTVKANELRLDSQPLPEREKEMPASSDDRDLYRGH